MLTLLGNVIIAASIFLAAVYFAAEVRDIMADYYDLATPDQPPDLPSINPPMESPINEPDSPDENDFGSDELHRKNNAHDEKIARLQAELELLNAEHNRIKNNPAARPGMVYEEDHKIVDSQYIRIPKEEYAE